MALKNAEAKEPGWFYNYLTCITLSALAFEALANAFGEKLVPNWNHFDRLNPLAKFLLVAKALDIEVDFSCKPWSQAQWLYKLRNEIAHAKPYAVKESKIMSQDKYNTSVTAPQSSLEKQITLGNAQKAYKTVNEVKHLLCDKIDPYEQFGLRSDVWTGSAKHVDSD